MANMHSTAPVNNKFTRSTLHPGLHKYPGFYACYLLRSYQNGKPNQRTYVGSTPDPPRRIRQHNGQLKGGAVRTKCYRPWEMEVICFGFPSKLVALQFEWAWNTPYKSRHLQINQKVLHDDLNQAKLNPQGSIAVQVNAVTQSKKPLFPRSMGNRVEVKLKVLRKMITSLPWSQYPLKVLFFEQGAYKLWLEQGRPAKSLLKNNSKNSKISFKEDGSVIHPIDVMLQPEGVDGMRKIRYGLPTSAEDKTKPLEVYDEEAILEDYEKVEAIKKRTNGNLKCYTCKQHIDIESHLLYLNCPSSTCMMSAHILCLVEHFLSVPSPEKNQSFSSSLKSVEDPVTLSRVLPDRGCCPACSLSLRWGELIKSCYRRMPGNPTKAVISASDEDVNDSGEEDNNSLDLKLNYHQDRSLKEIGKSYHQSKSSKTLKKLNPSCKPIQMKSTKFSKSKKVTPTQVYDEGTEDEPEQDFVKMMDELQVSD